MERSSSEDSGLAASSPQLDGILMRQEPASPEKLQGEQFVESISVVIVTKPHDGYICTVDQQYCRSKYTKNKLEANLAQSSAYVCNFYAVVCMQHLIEEQQSLLLLHHRPCKLQTSLINLTRL